MNRWTQTTLALVAATLIAAPAAHAQFQKAPEMGSFAASPYEGYGAYGGAYGPGYGGGYDPSAYGAGPSGGASLLHTPLPGPLAVGIHGAGEGLGYEGSYVFAHQVVPLGTDSLHGWWLIDARAALSEEGQPFANIGVVRRTYFAPACADLGLGVFYDYDADEYDEFGHDFHQVGVSAHVWTHYFDLNINGYIPVGDTSYLIGSENSPFYHDLLVVQLGIDSALEGFDMEVGLRPDFCAQHSGTFYFGGYAFQGDGVDPFGGFQSRFSFQPHDGWTLTAGITTDDEFHTNALLQLEWNWGSSRGYSPTGRDLDPIRRNAHIVRANQTPIFGSDPDTGLLYRVVHVDNFAPDNGNGFVENPFNNLEDAQNASLPGNIIFVHPGVSTDGLGNQANLAGYDNGIVLQDDQYFLGEGVFHTIPTIEVGDFTFLAGTPGIRPSITNPDGPAVTLASNNVVAGFNIVFAETGVFGDGVVDAEVRDNNVIGAEFNGVEIQNSTGQIALLRNFVDGSGLHGMLVQDTTGELLVQDNASVNNGIGVQDGLRVTLDGGGAAAGLVATIIGNTFDGNGVGLFVGAEGAGTVVNATILGNNSISDNLSNGIEIDSRNDGHVNFFIVGNQNITGNGAPSGAGAGIRVGVFDATANGLIADNVLSDNVGSTPTSVAIPMGIGVSVFGDAQLDLEIAGNLISGTGLAATTSGGEGITLDFETSDPTLVSNINIHDNVFTDLFGDIIVVNADDDSRADILVADNIAVPFTGATVNSIGSAFDIATFDDAVVRITALRNNFSNLSGLGGGATIFLNTFGTSRLIGNFDRNTFDSNGGDGLLANAVGGDLVLDFTNNVITNHAGDGVDLNAFVAGNLFAIFSSNEIALNGGVQFQAQIDTVALTAADMGLSFLNQNVFGAAPLLSNNSPGPPVQPFATFIFETDGTSTPAFPIIVVPPVTQVPVGTVDAIMVPLRVFP